MKITCICPTHGRAHIIGESVESFLRQFPLHAVEYELLIVNDCPEQPLECHAAGVRVVNLPVPVPDAAAKFNAAVALADCDLCAWWEDDDISLPGRLRGLIERMGPHGYIKPARAWLWQDQRIKGIASNLFFGGCMFDRQYWDATGGSVPGQWADASAHWQLMAGGRGEVLDLGPRDTWFVYRWGGPVHHDSGTGEQDAAKRFADFRARTLGHPRFRPGPQVVEPRWRRDYRAEVNAWIERNAHGNG
jgi:glycosyltransferase involved in cell wall biosynthesis